MSELAASQSAMSGAQILARLSALSPAALADIAAALPPSTIGATILAAQTIQAVRVAERWALPPGVKLAQYTLSR